MRQWRLQRTGDRPGADRRGVSDPRETQDASHYLRSPRFDRLLVTRRLEWEDSMGDTSSKFTGSPETFERDPIGTFTDSSFPQGWSDVAQVTPELNGTSAFRSGDRDDRRVR